MDPYKRARKRNIAGEYVASSSMKSEIRMDSPICLIENTMESDGSKLVVNPEAINILSQIQQPVVVVSIVGMYRTGKSYLMNRLAGARKGFSLGGTIQSHTKGIWMWCVPHPTLKDHVLVLLDTEGLGDVEKGDLRNDSKIFALAVLLSSALVYNSMGTINEEAVNKLKLVGEITEIIKVKTGNADNEANYSTYFPIFIWTVRDLTLGLEINGETVTADGYLENSLKLKKPENSPEDKQYNDLRNQIRMYFGKRKCFVFDTPTDSKKLLKELEDLPDDRLEESFLDQSALFCDYIFENAKVKTIDITINVTGWRLSELAKLYTTAMNSSRVACLDQVVASLAETENEIAIQEATKFYEDKMRTIDLPTETLQQFLDLNREYENEAREIFLKRSIKDTDQKYLTKFLNNIVHIRKEFSNKNEEYSRKKCEALIKTLSKDLEKALDEGRFQKRGGHIKFQKALSSIIQKYNAKGGKGVKAEAVLQEYKTSKQADEIVIIQKDNALSQKQKQEEAERARREKEEMEERLKQLEEEQKNQKEDEEKANLEMTVQRLEETMEEQKKAMNEKLEQVTKEKERELDLYKKQGCPEQVIRYQDHIRLLQERSAPKGLFQLLGSGIDWLFGTGPQ